MLPPGAGSERTDGLAGLQLGEEVTQRPEMHLAIVDASYEHRLRHEIPPIQPGEAERSRENQGQPQAPCSAIDKAPNRFVDSVYLQGDPIGCHQVFPYLPHPREAVVADDGDGDFQPLQESDLTAEPGIQRRLPVRHEGEVIDSFPAALARSTWFRTSRNTLAGS